MMAQEKAPVTRAKARLITSSRSSLCVQRVIGRPDNLGDSHATAKIYTFDTSAAEIAKIKAKQVVWAIDQQPYLQGYESVDGLWLFLTNGNTLGGGQTVLTGPAFVDSSNVDAVAKYAQRGTR